MAMRTVFGPIVVALAIVLVASRDRVVVATGQHDHEHQTSGSASVPQPESPGTMMKMHQDMVAEMKAGDAKLDALIAGMNNAKGDDRIVAMSAVLNELARQHKGMRTHMGDMPQMMGGCSMKGR
jgi:hypothetical protein